MKNYFIILFRLLVAIPIFYSCEDFFNVESEEVLVEEDYMGEKFNARSALFGVLSQIQDISKQHLVLGELRGDLMDITDESVKELRQISEHNVGKGNSYSNLEGFFSIINNCNYALAGIDKLFESSSSIKEEELRRIYASLLRVRTWTHLQIAINFNKVPYITKPISSANDISGKYPLLTFTQAIDSLINGLLPFTNVDNIEIYGNSLGFDIYNLIPNNDLLLGDLYLWSDKYPEAAASYKQFLDKNVFQGGDKYNLTKKYNVTFSLSGSVYRTTSFNWRNIFQENVQTDEVIMCVPFTKQYKQPNYVYDDLIKDYQVKPSAAIIRNWEQQYRILDNIMFDSIDTRAELSFSGTKNLPVITKYKYGYLILSRAADVYLKYAEAINRAGYPLHSLYVLNSGVKDVPSDIVAPRFTGNPESFLNFEQSKYYTISGAGVATGGNLGVRGRVGMAPVRIENALNKSDSIQKMELLILNESALECAFEGNRWPNLMRIALRNNNPGILADAVANKFYKNGSPLAGSIRSRLMDKENWFLNFDEDPNFVPVK